MGMVWGEFKRGFLSFFGGACAMLWGMSDQIIRVVVPLFMPQGLDYVWRGAETAAVGAMVDITVGRKNVHGVVVEILDKSPYKNLKGAEPVYDDAGQLVVLPLQVVDYYRFVARYTLSAPGDPLRAGLVKGLVPQLLSQRMGVQLVEALPQGVKMTAAREKVLSVVEVDKIYEKSELAALSGVSDGVVRGLVSAGFLEEVPLQSQKEACPVPRVLNEEQAVAATSIKKALGTFQPFLLDGVTGSGKTEVYFDVMAKVLGAGHEPQNRGQVLVLVPEIALTPQWLERFETRFGTRPVAWHSGLSQGARARAWWAVYSGEAQVVVGARSALFLPWQQLELVVVDEEHDGSYKQSDVFRYHGRDMAVVLARFWGCPAVLASATPSLETYQNALSGRYTHLTLKKRHGEAVLPSISIVDLKQGKLPSSQFLSEKLVGEVEKTLEKKQQALLFMNRRGTAPLLLCKTCGHKVMCSKCDANLTAHGTRMVCHYCGYTEQQPNTCPECHDEGSLGLYGPGTRRIVAEVQEKFPDARVAVADSDALTTAAQMSELVDKVANDRVDILVGTQMIAKGHHFPKLTFVGVVDGDMGLAQGDVRAAERTFQLLTQVSGRAGRDAVRGRVMIQTFEPEHDLFKALKAHDRDTFYADELAAREEWGDPPFGRLVAFILSGKREQDVAKAGQMLAQKAPKKEGVRVLGPAPAPLAKLNDMYRYRLLLKGQGALQGYVQAWLSEVEIPRGVRVVIDIDPEFFG